MFKDPVLRQPAEFVDGGFISNMILRKELDVIGHEIHTTSN